MALTLSNPFLHRNISPPTLSLKTNVREVVGSNQMRWSCRKKEIHPEFNEDEKVYCNGELVMTTGGTKKEYAGRIFSTTTGEIVLPPKRKSNKGKKK